MKLRNFLHFLLKTDGRKDVVIAQIKILEENIIYP